jgi:hypothetical protein
LLADIDVQLLRLELAETDDSAEQKQPPESAEFGYADYLGALQRRC